MKANKFNKLKDIKVQHTLNEKDLKENPLRAKQNFISNMDSNYKLRKIIWEKIYWDVKTKLKFRNNFDLFLIETDKEYTSMNDKEKSEWFDFVTNDSKALGVVGELNYIVQSLKLNKGNMKKVWNDLKMYGEMKRKEEIIK